MKSLIKWLSTPYYFNPSTKFKLKVSFAFGLFAFLFLYIFKPFNLSNYGVLLLEYTFGIGIIDFLGTFIILYVFPLIFKNYFNEDNWTVGRNIFLMAISLLLIGTVLWKFGEIYKEPYDFRKASLLEFLYKTFLVGIMPLTLFVFINEKKVRERREKKVFKIKETNTESENIFSKEIRITSDNGKENISFQIEDLVYITSQGNYASFFLKNQEVLKEKILRLTLTKIEDELKDYPHIMRFHKSYIVNSSFINDINGNARGYLLKLNLVPTAIPVSRKFSKESLKVFFN